ncbi:MAG: hypothetical protein JST00_07920 [Deltaproteobacteria bacterium]|nr:hypothetical protein [Deltaproteobacteria bacterium]
MNGRLPQERAPRRRRIRRAAVLTAALAMGFVVVEQHACVLVEDSGPLPRPPAGRPTIVRGSVVPSASRVLTTFPSQVIIPVELTNPTEPFEYAAFVDYNSVTGEGLVVPPTRSFFEPDNLKGRTRILTVGISAPSDLQRCHVIEVVVALRLESDKSPQTSRTPTEPGGDIVTWFYNPNGDLGGCPATESRIDSGIDAADADAGEAGEGGVQ